MRVILSLGCLFTTVLLGCAGAVPAPNRKLLFVTWTS